MRVALDVFHTKVGLCNRCYKCVRNCPVKAIKLTESALEIDKNLCVYCGACVTACSQSAIVTADDSSLVRELMKAGPTVAVAAPEIEAAWPGVSFAQLSLALTTLGFYAVEELVLAEEMVASAYTDLLNRDLAWPVIRSTCPAIVNYIEVHRPELVERLAPIASPMVVQGRIIKRLYPEEPAVVFIGPCIAKKAEIFGGGVDSVDYVITFNQLGLMFSEAGIDPSKMEPRDDDGPALSRALSVPGGFPRRWLTSQVGLGELIVSRDVSGIDEILLRDNPVAHAGRFFDLLSCRGCIDGPAFGATDLSARLAAARRALARPRIKLGRDDVEPFHDLVLSRTFTPRPLKAGRVSAEQLKNSLASVGLADPTRRLDCAICGYDTCVEHAAAVVAGFSEWTACFPHQRQTFLETTARLREASLTDGLTGLVNHRGFVEILASEFQRHVRYRSQLSIIMIDVDNFKQINDTHGHLQGDKVLKLLAQILRKNLRETDIAARYGGDEFAVILPEITKIEAAAVAEKLRERVRSTVFWLGEDIKETVSLSLGVCDIADSDTESITVLSRADKALYEAKETGRNRTIVG